VVVSRQMPWVWLKCGDVRTLEDRDRGSAVGTAHENSNSHSHEQEHTGIYPGSEPS
jgi:hypothetical protein